MAHFKSTEYSDRLLEVISNQLQLANLYTDGIHSAQNQIDGLKIKIINQRAELGIDVGGV